jgi:hypothetical protein
VRQAILGLPCLVAVHYLGDLGQVTGDLPDLSHVEKKDNHTYSKNECPVCKSAEYMYHCYYVYMMCAWHVVGILFIFIFLPSLLSIP